MSTFTRDMFEAARSSTRGLNVGTVTDPRRMTWGEVHEQARRMGGALAGRGIGRHGSVAVLAAGAADVAPLAQAIWMRGASLTMLQQPTPRADLTVWIEDTARAIRMIGAEVVVVGEPFLAVMDHLVARSVAVCTVESLRAAEPVEPEDPDESNVAMRQLTSGSTGIPKAVEISHANLAANAIAIAAGLAVDVDRDVMLSWLPLSHDMGMVAFICFPMQLGIEAVVITSDQFLRRPIVWAELIGKYRATITSGPNFAYSILARVLEGRDPNAVDAIDLSSLRIACNGAEPVDHRDLERFAAVGARFGLRPAAPMPSYGLAEATLGVSFHAHDEPPVVDVVSRTSVSESHYAKPSPADAGDAQHIVCLGVPLPGMEVRITRGSTALGARQIGEVELRGPAIANSYLTMEGIVQLGGDDGWFDTGDLGYLDEQGRVYVCGRTKDVIVLAGVNLYPHDIERAAATVDGVRKGCVIALRSDPESGGGEREGFVVLAEANTANESEARLRISREITAQVSRHVGHAPREVRVFPPGTLPKTSSGKLRRTSARALL